MDNLNQIFESILLDLFEEKTPQEIEAAKQAHAVEIAKSGRKEDPDLVRRKTLPTPSKKKETINEQDQDQEQETVFHDATDTPSSAPAAEAMESDGQA